MFRRIEQQGIGIWQYSELAEYENLVHGFSERGKNGEFNLALHTGDDNERVIANRRKWTEALNIDINNFVTMEQVHGINIEIVGKNECGRGVYDYATTIPMTDGLLTNEAGVALFACFADCVPLYFYDPIKQVIGLSHGGWKGTVGGIAPLTAEKMVEKFGSDYRDIRVAIAPSIGACHYEVDERVIGAVEKYNCADMVLSKQTKGHAHLDLPKLNKLLLMEKGVKEEHIFLSKMCTFCHNEEFFSYRAENGKTGRMSAVIMLK